MDTRKILARAPNVLDESQRASYFSNSYLVLDDCIGADWLERIWEVTNGFIEESRGVPASNDKFDVEDDHSVEQPRLRRLSYLTAHHSLYWEFASCGPIVDVAEDLLGPDVVFHHLKLNFKLSRGGEEVKWHQDYPFYPQTGYSILAIGLYVSDVDAQMGLLRMTTSWSGPSSCPVFRNLWC